MAEQDQSEQGEASQNRSGASGEILVTATRRSQSILSVPYNISAVQPEALEDAGVSNLNDLTRVAPGLQTIDTGPVQQGNNSNLVLRGLRVSDPGSAQPNLPRASVGSVSTYYGETPIFLPLMIRDLERVEVLRGPQGTLYGSGAQAGTLRFIPNRPDFSGFYGEVEMRGAKTYNSDGDFDYGGDIVLNAPLSDQLAFRLNASYEKLAGFIDEVAQVAREDQSDPLSKPLLADPTDPFSGFVFLPPVEGANDTEQWQVHAQLRWQPVDELDINLEYLHQETEADDLQQSNPVWDGGPFDFGDGSMPQTVNVFAPGGKYRSTNLVPQPYDNTVDLGSMVLTYDMGMATFTSATSVYESKTNASTDFTWAYFFPAGDGSFFNLIYYYGYYPRHNAFQMQENTEKAFVQEVRLASNWDKPIDYVIGGYYNDLDNDSFGISHSPGLTDYLGVINFPDANPGSFNDVTTINNQFFKFKDRAVFGELTYHITDRWQVTGGIRFFWQDFEISSYQLIPIFTPEEFATETFVKSKVNDHIFKVNTSYEFADSNLVYFTFSEGFRRGGGNTLDTTGFFAALPSLNVFTPDIAQNWEIGAKGMISGSGLRYDISLYQIDVDNPQFTGATASGFSAVFNGEEARTRGLELQLDWRATDNFNISVAYAYTDAELTADTVILDLPIGALFQDPIPAPIPAVQLESGQRLPGVPKHAIGGAMDYTIPFDTGASIKLHVDTNYRSSSPGSIDPNGVNFWRIPNAFFSNARVTYDSGENWSIDAFVTNITNETGFSGGFGRQVTPYFGSERIVSRPRQFGLAGKFKF
jgi:outer membrane receptor protein involved in Fe transport